MLTILVNMLNLDSDADYLDLDPFEDGYFGPYGRCCVPNDDRAPAMARYVGRPVVDADETPSYRKTGGGG